MFLKSFQFFKKRELKTNNRKYESGRAGLERCETEEELSVLTLGYYPEILALVLGLRSWWGRGD